MSAVPLSATAAKRRIGDILLAHGFVTEEQIAEATAEQERTQQPLGQILVGQGSITRLELASALAEQWSDPAASIPSTPRTAPAPALAPVPSPQDEAQYAARLQEAVADLARKVQSNKPLDGIDERVEELSRRIESTLARTQHIEAAVATLAESLEGVTTGVEEAFHMLQTGTANLATDMARIEQSVSELTARQLPEGDDTSLAELAELRSAVAELGEKGVSDEAMRTEVGAVAARLDELAGPLDELRRTVSDLEEMSSSTAELAERLDRVEVASGDEHLRTALDGQAALLDDLRAMVEELQGRPVEALELDARLALIETQLGSGAESRDDLTEAVAALRQEWATKDRLAPATDERFAEIATEVATLRAGFTSLATRGDHRAGADRRLDELEKARLSDLDTVDVLARAMDRIRHDLTTAPPSAGSESSTVTELGQRMAALEESRVVEPAAGHDPSELASEIERFKNRLSAVHNDLPR